MPYRTDWLSRSNCRMAEQPPFLSFAVSAWRALAFLDTLRTPSYGAPRSTGLLGSRVGVVIVSR
jgi:hypothetical protein